MSDYNQKLIKKVAIMQPYVFPYIGYFQLINCVDVFMLLDDVNYINRGWINRNNILVNNNRNLFTIPLSKASQNKKINNIKMHPNNKWREKLLKKIYFSYKKAPYFEEVYTMLQSVINSDVDYISELNLLGIQSVNAFLGINTQIKKTSDYNLHDSFKGEERIIELCILENANTYVNAIGGKEIYNEQNFKEVGIELRFINSQKIEYPQFGSEFVPYLSIIDVLMFNSKDVIKNFLDRYTLILE